jgi:hypothetical protein
MKTGKSRSRLPLPYLIRADSRIPDLFVNQAMINVAAFLECNKFGNEFIWLCRTINVEGKADVSFAATQLAIRRHEEAGRLRLVKHTKIERRFDEEAEFEYDVEIDSYHVVPDDSLFTWWEEQESGDTNAATANSSKPIPPRLTVDLACKTVTLDGTKYDVSSENAIRWVKVLAEHPGEWISSSELTKYDSDLIVRTDRLKRFLPTQVLALIEQRTGAGSRIRL